MTNPWVLGARPRTLPAAVVPVAVGTAAATGVVDVIAWRAVAALVVSLALQVAVNYANDYSDGIRGTDEARVGPVRLVASGLKAPAAVKRAAFAAMGVAGLAGGALTLAVGPELLVVGAAAMLAAWFYTGGPRPYGYAGLGELFVFVFFGVVATAGSTYVQTEELTGLSLWASVAVGAWSCAMLVVNNLRDIPTDTVSGKKTLAVRLGACRTRGMYVTLVLGGIGVAATTAMERPWAALVMLSLPLAVVPVRLVRRGADGRELITVLGATGRMQLVAGALLSIGLWLSA
jgi:1,4-dihydroxy-2-naphthoate octaprenyltransferase